MASEPDVFDRGGELPTKALPVAAAALQGPAESVKPGMPGMPTEPNSAGEPEDNPPHPSELSGVE